MPQPSVTRVKSYALVNLLGDAFRRLAIGWIKGIIIAKSATVSSQRAIAIWAAVTSIYSQFLHPMAK
jgi:hypothetical protein